MRRPAGLVPPQAEALRRELAASGVWMAHTPSLYCKRRATPTVKGYRNRKPIIEMVTDPKTRAFELEINQLCRLARGRQPMRDAGCVLGIMVLDEISDSWGLTPKGKPTKRALRAMAQEEPAAADMDRTNILKAAEDGARKAFYNDDPRVHPLIWRGWAPKKEAAGVWIFCWEEATPRGQMLIEETAWPRVRRAVIELFGGTC